MFYQYMDKIFDKRNIKGGKIYFSSHFEVTQHIMAGARGF